jgi:molybdopterin synthase sulfur carrier subunit
MTTVFIPTTMRKATGDNPEIEAAAGRLGDVLSRCTESHPGLRTQLFDDGGAVKRYINVFVNGADMRTLDGLDTAVGERDEIILVPAMAGG